MKRFLTAATAVLIIAGSVGSASAAPRHDDRHDNRGPEVRHDNGNHYGQHKTWRKGGRIDRSDWNRGARVDYRRHHLRAPPRGYEWRQVDNNYVLAAAATGLIASIILSSH